MQCQINVNDRLAKLIYNVVFRRCIAWHGVSNYAIMMISHTVRSDHGDE